ncbi:carboxypeptidase Y-deficient [Savitreella phatthalungensis]
MRPQDRGGGNAAGTPAGRRVLGRPVVQHAATVDVPSQTARLRVPYGTGHQVRTSSVSSTLSSSSHLHPPSSFDEDAHSPANITCPICQLQLSTLQALNRHLDDAHAEIAATQDGGMRSWFKGKNILTRNATVQAITRSIGLSEDFQRNGHDRSNPNHPSAAPTGIESAKETDELVSRAHWQRADADADLRCSLPGCERKLKYRSRPVHCRHCGQIYCDQHTMYQMRLSRAATYEPVRGIWCRVCKTCYEARPWYSDTRGAERDQTATFKDFRLRSSARHQLETNRLTKRLDRLLTALAFPDASLALSDEAEVNGHTQGLQPQAGGALSMSSLFSGLSTLSKSQTRKRLEQSVVAWEDDRGVTSCRLCDRPFNSYARRRHHCRLCGKVRCGDPETECSAVVPFSADKSFRADKAGITRSTQTTPEDQTTKGSDDEVRIDLRLCKLCQHSVFGTPAAAAARSSKTNTDRSAKPEYIRIYETLRDLERGIAPLVPRFQHLLDALDGGGGRAPSSVNDGTSSAATPDGSVNGDFLSPPALTSGTSGSSGSGGLATLNALFGKGSTNNTAHSRTSSSATLSSTFAPPAATSSSVGLTRDEVREVARVRKRLIDALGRYDAVARSLAPNYAVRSNSLAADPPDLESGPDGETPAAEVPAVVRAWRASSPEERKIRLQMLRRATTWLHAHTTPLTSLPKVVSKRERAERLAALAAPVVENQADSPPSETVAEEVLPFLEQKFLLESAYNDAVKRRAFDEASALKENIGEITKEISRLSPLHASS